MTLGAWLSYYAVVTAEKKTREKRRKEDSDLMIWGPKFSFSGDAFALDHVTSVGFITDFDFDDDLVVVGLVVLVIHYPDSSLSV